MTDIWVEFGPDQGDWWRGVDDAAFNSGVLIIRRAGDPLAWYAPGFWRKVEYHPDGSAPHGI